MSQSAWHHFGDGFTDVVKFSKLISNALDGSFRKDDNSDIVINTDKTPKAKKLQGKRKIVSRSNIDMAIAKRTIIMKQSSNGVQNVSFETNGFLSNFTDILNPDIKSDKAENIEWSSCSSDDEEKINETHEPGTSQSNGATKRRCFSQDRLIMDRSHNEHSTLCSITMHSSNKLPPTRHTTLNKQKTNKKLSSEGDNLIIESDSPVDNKLGKCEQSKPKFQTLSEKSTQAYAPVESTFGLSPFPNTSTQITPGNVWSYQKNSCSKPRVVRRLDTEMFQDSPDQISDIDSVSDSDSSEIKELTVEEISDSEGGVQQPLEESVGTQDVDINSGVSSSPDISKEKKIRASDWVTALLKQKTPSKQDLTSCQEGEDSAKKKKKHAKDSIAGQLSRLLNREKASVRFWYHSLSTETNNEAKGKSVTVSLLTLDKRFSLYVAQCKLLNETEGDLRCKVLFTINTVESLALKPGITVQIFPPWQQLEECSGEKTLLCTQYVRIVSSVQNPTTKVATNTSENLHNVSATWECPCSKDQSIPASSCPAVKFPVISPIQRPEDIGPRHPAKAVLHSINATPWCHESSNVRRTFLESKEGMGRESTYLPPFLARVIRIFRCREENLQIIRHHLLMEDTAGTIIFISLPEDFTDISSLWKLYGKSCLCSGLVIESRINRDIEPELFGIIDITWTLQPKQSQQSGTDSSQLIQSTRKCPNFAYWLKSANGYNCIIKMDVEDSQIDSQASELMDLKDTVQMDRRGRVSFLAKVVVNSGFKEASVSPTVFVFDESSIQNGFTAMQKLEVDSSCVLENMSSVCFFQDVISDKGFLHCDKFTLILGQKSWAEWEVPDRLGQSAIERIVSCPLVLPEVSVSCSSGDFVRVEGIICEIDENTAFSWEECPVCGCDTNTTEDSGSIVCTNCKSQVDSLVTRMKMEAYVQCQSMPNGSLVKINLTQRSIESVLPQETDDEGYDMDQVIKKPLNCPVCRVEEILESHNDNNVAVNQTRFKLVEFDNLTL
ncbi:DNA repair-scaffolding protein-like [Physella acuta]|uniref:DNA repair-scaffolding protein-like n=1 Tax=Physella acuta TaxID=109671 RepID=UPI0027DD08FB|nr:DNA repair-scaffolding protein-like [Physella acuta]